MKKKLAILLVGTMIASSILAGCGSKKSEPTKKETSGELKGDITFWHSFTQGPRMEVIQQTADQFMKDNPGVKIKIETFSWGDFYTKWTTGLASGNVPDMSTALPGHVVEMMDADALEPVDDLIDDIGRNKFSKTALSEGKKDGTCYSLPLYSHAQVMWYRKDLLQKAGLSVPKTWDEFAEAAKTLTKDGVYGCSFPCGSNDLMATRFLNFYVRSGGGSLLTDDLKANLTSDLAIDGINYWLDIYKNCSPKDSVNYAVLDQANLFYQGKTAFDFNSGFQISGVETNSPDLVDQIDCAPLPKINADDPDYGAETSNIPMVVWKNSKHPEICKDQYEAAQIDGASKVQQFWYITVPHIKVVVGLLVVLRTIWVFNNFDIIYLLTGGGPANATTTMPIYAYNMGWNTKLLGRSSAVTMLLLAFLLLVCVIYFTIIGKWEKEDK